MQPPWRRDVARHLHAAAELIASERVAFARAELDTAIGYLLRAAGDGDDDAFELLRVLRAGIEEAEPTQVMVLEPERR